MANNYVDKVLNGHLSKDDFGKVYFLNEEAAIDFAEAYHRTKCAENEPVAKVAKNTSGQITIQKPDGSYFDISKHIGVMLYTNSQSSDSEAKLKVLVDFLKYHADSPNATYDYAGNELNNIAKQALEKIGERTKP